MRPNSINDRLAPAGVPSGINVPWNVLDNKTIQDHIVAPLKMAIDRVNGGGKGDKSSDKGLSGNNWEFNPVRDVDWRGTGKTYRDALDEAFIRTGIPKEKFTVEKWGKDANGKTVPVEWSGPGGANVNMDIPEWNNVKPNGTLGEGPHQPHIGYQTPGKGAKRTRGHIFIDVVPATRR